MTQPEIGVQPPRLTKRHLATIRATTAVSAMPSDPSASRAQGLPDPEFDMSLHFTSALQDLDPDTADEDQFAGRLRNVDNAEQRLFRSSIARTDQQLGINIVDPHPGASIRSPSRIPLHSTVRALLALLLHSMSLCPGSSFLSVNQLRKPEETLYRASICSAM